MIRQVVEESGACADDETGKTGDTGDTGDTGNTGDTDLSAKAHTLVTRATTEMLRAVLEQRQKIACKRVELVAGYPVAMFQLCVSGSETQWDTQG